MLSISARFPPIECQRLRRRHNVARLRPEPAGLIGTIRPVTSRSDKCRIAAWRCARSARRARALYTIDCVVTILLYRCATRMTRSLLLASRVRDRDPLSLEALSHTPVEFALNGPPPGIGAFDLTDNRHPGRADLV